MLFNYKKYKLKVYLYFIRIYIKYNIKYNEIIAICNE